MLAVYFRLMIVSITVTNNVLDVLDVVGGGCGSDLPVVGMSPAKIEVDRAHISATAIANFFMDIAPLRLRKCQRIYIKNNGTLRQDFLQGRVERINIRFAFAQLLRQSKVSNLMRTTSPKLDTSHTIKGTYHNQLGINLRAIASASRKRTDYFRRAVKHYRIADEYFKLARHVVFRAHVKNNIGNVLRDLHHFGEAHQFLEQARRLFMRVGDKVRVAQVDDTRAQVFTDEGKYADAELTARTAARSFQRAGRQCFLAETLINQGIALARMHEPERAQFVFQRAIEIAHHAGSLNRAGLAALAMIEEIETLPREVQSAAYAQAREWLASSDSPDMKPRLNAIAKKIDGARSMAKTPNAYEVLFNKRLDLADEVLKFERGLISQALVKVNGKVTHAAELLGVGYQTLAHMIETKHPDLLKKRTPVRRRPRKKRSKAKKT
jgi:tetratricopeptide (TPR) repeat protein